MEIFEVTQEDTEYIQQMAALLVDGFRDTGTTSWPDLESGLKEVQECLAEDRISLAAVDGENEVIGWIGGLKKYNYTWELHPLVVDENHRGQGTGRKLVRALEEKIREAGGMTICLGTDDENFRTSVSGIDLYPDVLQKLIDIKNPGRHPYEFYQKVGYSITGIIPDANGPGKPDIMMAKRIGLNQRTHS